MTEFNLMSVVVGVIIVAIMASTSVAFIQTNIVETETNLKTSAKDIDIINAAHIIKQCLEAEEGISKSLLDSKEGEGICEICGNEAGGSCKTESGIGFKVKDLESAKEWNFGYAGDKKHKTELFVNIVHDTGKITMGRLYAEI